LIANQKLVYNKQSVIPASISEEFFDKTQTFDYTPTDILLYEGEVEDFQNMQNQIEFVQKFQEAYSGSIVTTLDRGIKEIVEIEVDLANPSGKLLKTANILLSESLALETPDYTEIAANN
jgi:hypothetical protein